MADVTRPGNGVGSAAFKILMAVLGVALTGLAAASFDAGQWSIGIE